MPIRRKSGNVNPTIVRRRSGAAFVNVGFVRRRVGSAWVDALALTASASPTSVSGSQSTPVGGPTSINITTNATTVTPVGGVAPYTYSWALIASNGAWQIGSASSATSNFTAPSVVRNGTRTGTFRCTVTDAIGQTAPVDVGANCTHIYLA